MTKYNHFNLVRMMNCGNTTNTDATVMSNSMLLHVNSYPGDPIRGCN